MTVTRSVSIYSRSVTVDDLRRLLDEAAAIGAEWDTPVRVTIAPTSPHPTDPGGEITIKIAVES